MAYLYAVLVYFLAGSATDRLPADTLLRVDPYDPLESSVYVDAVFKHLPEGIVTDLCLVESGGCRKPISIHDCDRWVGKKVLSRVQDRGYLPSWCPFYWGLGMHPQEVSTRGNHGQVYAFSVHRLGECLPLDTLDIPLLSALATALRVEDICRRKGYLERKKVRAGLKAAVEPCTVYDVRRAWAGKHKDPEGVDRKWDSMVSTWRSRRHTAIDYFQAELR